MSVSIWSSIVTFLKNFFVNEERRFIREALQQILLELKNFTASIQTSASSSTSTSVNVVASEKNQVTVSNNSPAKIGRDLSVVPTLRVRT